MSRNHKVASLSHVSTQKVKKKKKMRTKALINSTFGVVVEEDSANAPAWAFAVTEMMSSRPH